MKLIGVTCSERCPYYKADCLMIADKEWQDSKIQKRTEERKPKSGGITVVLGSIMTKLRNAEKRQKKSGRS